METNIVNWGSVGVIAKNMETRGILGLCRDDGEENANYYSILGLCNADGNEHGTYDSTPQKNTLKP